MIYGDIPFEDDNDIVNCSLDFKKYSNVNIRNPYYANVLVNNNNNNNNNNNTNVSDLYDVNNLIKKCLKVNANERIKLEDIFKHKWFSAAN
jgi:serine/threonine protein kinase